MPVVFSQTFVQVNTNLMFQPGGQVHRWSAGVARELETAAKSLAPPRRSEARWGTWATGRLQRSIYRELFTAGTTNLLSIEVGATAPYTMFVHDGTANQGRRYIYTNLGWANKRTVDSWVSGRFFEGTAADRGFWMPITRLPGRPKYALRVRGQKANPFIRDGYRIVQYRHNALPRMRGR